MKLLSSTSIVDLGATDFGTGFDYASARLVARLLDGGDLGNYACMDFVQLAGAYVNGWGVEGSFSRQFGDERGLDPPIHPWLTASETEFVDRVVESTDVELWGRNTPESIPYHYTFAAIDMFDLHVVAQTCVVRTFSAPTRATRGKILDAADELGPFTGWDPKPESRRLAFDCRFEIPGAHRAWFAAIDDPTIDPKLLNW